jgi:hypothetical protein
MSKKDTPKSILAREYLDRYSDYPTNVIARMLHSEFPDVFENFDNARATVRYNRGEMPSRNRKYIQEPVAKRTEEEKKLAMNRFNLPTSDYESIEPFVIPRLNDRGLIMNDIHLPYQDNEALEIAVNYGINFKPNFVYLNGDTIDMYQASRFSKDRRLRDLAGELEITRHFLMELKEVFDCPIYFKIGNHEERWQTYLRANAPELLGISDFELANVLRFGELGVQEVKSKQIAKIGNFTLAHGHEFGQSVFSPVNAARGLYTRAKIDCAIGHHHVTSEHSEKDMAGNVVTTYSIGSLCGLSPEYLPYNKWNHGFATIETQPDGTYEFRNLKIINGKVI